MSMNAIQWFQWCGASNTYACVHPSHTRGWSLETSPNRCVHRTSLYNAATDDRMEVVLMRLGAMANVAVPNIPPPFMSKCKQHMQKAE